jgi:hypothetical protein
MHGWAANWVEKDREPNIPPAPAELSTSSPLTRKITHELTTPMHASLLPIVISPALLLSSSLSFVLTLSGGELRDTHFCQKTTTLQNTETSQKNEANACGQTKIDDVALSPSQGEATSTQTHPMAYTIAQRHTGIGTTTLSRPSFPCWVGRDEAVLLKKPIRPRNKVHTSTNSLFLWHQHNYCWRLFVSARIIHPNFCTRMLQNKVGRWGGGYLSWARPWQRFARFASWLAHSVPEHMICLQGRELACKHIICG